MSWQQAPLRSCTLERQWLRCMRVRPQPWHVEVIACGSAVLTVDRGVDTEGDELKGSLRDVDLAGAAVVLIPVNNNPFAEEPGGSHWCVSVGLAACVQWPEPCPN